MVQFYCYSSGINTVYQRLWGINPKPITTEKKLCSHNSLLLSKHLSLVVVLMGQRNDGAKELSPQKLDSFARLVNWINTCKSLSFVVQERRKDP